MELSLPLDEARLQNQEDRMQHLEELVQKQAKTIEFLMARLANTECVLTVYFTALAASTSHTGCMAMTPPGVPPEVAANIAQGFQNPYQEPWTQFPAPGW